MSDETTATIDRETWKALHALNHEMGVSKKALIKLAVIHLSSCEEAKRAISILGWDSEAIARIIQDSCELSLVTPLPA